MGKIAIRGATLLFFFFSIVILGATFYTIHIFGNVYFEQILLNRYGTLSAGSFVVRGYLLYTLIPAIVMLTVVEFFDVRKRYLIGISLAILVLCFLRLGGWAFVTNRFVYTDLYDRQYIEPKNQTYTFPKRKKNLIVLYLESLEKNYGDLSKTDGKNLLPHLSAQADAFSFDKFHQIPMQNYTIAAMVSSQCGIPHRDTPKDIFALQTFLANAVCYPQILKDNGYRTYFMKGSDMAFARTDLFTKTHGYDHLIGPKEIASDFGEVLNRQQGTSWGYRDRTLYKVAQRLLTDISKDPEPFMLAMETLDTHDPDIFLDPLCQKTDNFEKSVILCADSMAAEFIDWVRAQPFYADTTLVVLGDHLAIIRDLFDPDQQDLQIVNLFYNSSLQKPQAEKAWTTLDLAPTILESIGVETQSRAFGLGRSLFAPAPTLREQMGSGLDTELEKTSEMYNRFEEIITPEPTYKPYQAYGTSIENEEIYAYTLFGEIGQNAVWTDNFSVTLPQKTTQKILLTLSFKMFFYDPTEHIKVFLNGKQVAEKSFKMTDKQPFTYEVTLLPDQIPEDGKMAFEFRGKRGGNAHTLGLGMESIRFTLKD